MVKKKKMSPIKRAFSEHKCQAELPTCCPDHAVTQFSKQCRRVPSIISRPYSVTTRGSQTSPAPLSALQEACYPVSFLARALFPSGETHSLGSKWPPWTRLTQPQRARNTRRGDCCPQSSGAWGSSLQLKKWGAKQRQGFSFCNTFSIKVEYAEQ